jgi:hypothetical protein
MRGYIVLQSSKLYSSDSLLRLIVCVLLGPFIHIAPSKMILFQQSGEIEPDALVQTRLYKRLHLPNLTLGKFSIKSKSSVRLTAT